MPQSHSSSTEIQLGESPERGGAGGEKVIPRIRVCFWRRLETHFTLQNGPTVLNQSINKDQQSLFALSSQIFHFLLTSRLLPDLLHLVSPRPPSPPPPPLLSPPPARAKVERNKLPNLNEFTIIASPVVTEVGDLSVFNLSNLLLA